MLQKKCSVFNALRVFVTNVTEISYNFPWIYVLVLIFGKSFFAFSLLQIFRQYIQKGSNINGLRYIKSCNKGCNKGVTKRNNVTICASCTKRGDLRHENRL